MPYNPNIPEPTDAISDSQNDILVNFESIDAWVQVNHTGFDSPPNTGKHTVVEMPIQAAPTVTPINEVAIECLASAYNANGPELIYLTENGGPRVEMTAALKNAPGWSFLPSGILLKWGAFAVSALGADTEVFPAGATIPAFSAVFNGQLRVICTNANLDPNIDIYINSSTSNLTTLGYEVVTRDSNNAPVLPANVFYYVLGI